MQHHRSSVRSSRLQLLTNTGAILATLLAPLYGFAQTFDDVRANGSRVLVNQQSRIAATRADASGTAHSVTTAGPVTSTAASVAGNHTAASARANRVQQALSLDPFDRSSNFGSTSLVAGEDTAVANTDVVVANLQSLRGAPVEAVIAGSQTALDAGTVTTSALSVNGNSQDAAALGNDSGNIVVLSGISEMSGAGIVNAQRTDLSSIVRAVSTGTTGLSVGDANSSALELNGNRSRADGIGSVAANAMTMKMIRLAVPDTDGITSMVPQPGAGAAIVSAAVGILSHQTLGGSVDAAAGDPDDSSAIKLLARGTLAGSSLDTSGNLLGANARGNESANALSLEAGVINSDSSVASGPAANVTNVQRIDAARITAHTANGTEILVLGDARRASVSSSGNAVRTAATGNFAAGNLLAIKANEVSLGSIGRDGSNETRSLDYSDDGDPSLAPRGTALVGADGAASTTAVVSIQNVQDFGLAGVAAHQTSPAFVSSIDGMVTDTSIAVSDNVATAGATGNDATNRLRIDAGSLRASAGINNVQSGKGNVASAIGGDSGRGAAIITATGTVNSATLNIEGNAFGATSIGNIAANDLTVAANALGNNSSYPDARAGAIGSGYGAAATIALANDQNIGDVAFGGRRPQITSSVAGKFIVTDTNRLDGSTVSITGNSQRADAVASTSTNTLAVSATTLDATGAAVGAALSSTQYGVADVQAASTMRLSASGSLTDSQVTIADNSNQSLAVINDVTNMLGFAATTSTRLTGTEAIGSAGSFGPPRTIGDTVLANQQFAGGSVAAQSSTRFANVDGASGLERSDLSIASNLTRADASANQAVTALRATALTGGIGSTVLNSAQVSIASVSATAESTTGGASHPSDSARVTDSRTAISGNTISATARGNLADNSLAATGMNALASRATVDADRYESGVSAQAALLNSQTNLAAVTAVAFNLPAPLNSADLRISGAAVGVTDNTASATAYGNAASNAISVSGLGSSPTTAISNVQTNSGAVSARVTGTIFGIQSGPVTASALTLGGNQLVASATGNQAFNGITSAR